MPKKSKPIKPSPKAKRWTELPSDEAMRRLFGKKLVDAAKKVAHEKDDPEDREQEQD